MPGAVVRQQTGFGHPSTDTSLGAEYFTLGAGTDIAPLLDCLDDDACDVPTGGS